MNMRSRILACLTILMFLPLSARAALLPPWFVDTVVALGGDQCVLDMAGAQHCTWATEGTGFFYGYLKKDDPDPLKRQYSVYLVTARHVVADHPGEMHVRLNP
jgi:hypothetical protein